MNEMHQKMELSQHALEEALSGATLEKPEIIRTH